MSVLKKEYIHTRMSWILSRSGFVLGCFGFVSGLPFLLTLSTFTFWLSEAGISKTHMGCMFLAGLPYSLKWVWAPFLDQIHIPILSKRLGHRRSWALVSNTCLIITLVWLGHSQPEVNLYTSFTAAFCVCLCAATLDTVIDAYRIELLPDSRRAMGAAMESIGFRVGMLTSGAGALYLAEYGGWVWSYTIMAGLLSIGIVAIMIAPKIPGTVLGRRSDSLSKNWEKLSFWEPFKDLLNTPSMLYLFGFIFFFKAIDIILNGMSAPFLHEIGMSKIEFADISKIYGTLLMMLGALCGGSIITFFGDREGVLCALMLQVVSALMFTIQAHIGYHTHILIITIGVESFASGLTATVFITYLSRFCHAPHTATHFTFLYSLGSLSRILTSCGASALSDVIRWDMLFLGTCLLAIPSFYCLTRLEKRPMPS